MSKKVKILLAGLLTGAIILSVGCYESPEKVNDKVQDAVKILDESGLFD